MQLEMNSFVQENAWLQNPWSVHAVSMKTYQRQAWKPLGQARKPLQMCRESVSIVLCVCVWVCVCFRLIHQRHELNERITHKWLTATKWTTRKMCVFCQRESIVDLALNLISRRHAYKLMTNKELSEYDRIWIWLSCNKIWQKKWSLYLETQAQKIGSLYYMVVSANAGILQWEYMSMCMCMCIDMYNKCMSMRMCTGNGLTNRDS